MLVLIAVAIVVVLSTLLTVVVVLVLTSGSIVAVDLACIGSGNDSSSVISSNYSK